MTRFARAKGSKSSNERAPEDGTPWEVMKEQLLKAKEETEYSKKRQAAEQQRIANYENFLKEQKIQKRKATWCDFPEVASKKKPEASESQLNKFEQKLERNFPYEELDAEESGTIHKSNKKKKQKLDTSFQNDSRVTELESIPQSEKALKKKKKKKNKIAIQEQSSTKVDNSLLPDIESKTVTENNQIESKPKLKKNKKKRPVEQNQNKPDVNPDNNKVSMNANNTNNKPNLPNKKKNKKLVNGVPNRRKPINDNSFQLMINGKEVNLVRFDGYPIMEKDADRLHDLRNNMIKKGIPKSEIQRTMKLERRRAEKALARLKRDVCYNCRKGGHNLSDCPDLKSKIPGVDAADGICFKCGSTEHKQFECKVQRDKEFRFASCFICKEQGHIARQCPDNPKGLYPNGGGCKLCGDVTHLKKDCPTVQDKREGKSIKLNTLDNADNLEDIDQQPQNKMLQETKAPKKIKF